MTLAFLPLGLIVPDKEAFADGSTQSKKKNVVTKNVVQVLWSILNLLLTGIALFLSFSRNQGFHFGSALAACCCSPCYILYALAVPVSTHSSFF